MSIIDKGIDKLIGLEHVNVSYEQLGGMVQEHFIKGAEDGEGRKLFRWD